MSKRDTDLDGLLQEWPYQPGEVSARSCRGLDGRPLLQLRVEMGVLQMEVAGRPDGIRPESYDTYYDLMVATAFEEGEDFVLDAPRCVEIDREFVQFYHRRVAWLALREFRRAVYDSDHTLALMDFSTAHAPTEDWVELHEQYRPFVLFHRTQAEALAELEESNPEAALAAIDRGVESILQSLRRLWSEETDEEFPSLSDEAGHTDLDGDGQPLEQDDFLVKLRELRESIVAEYDLQSSLTVRLAEAIAREEYELAAQLRDQIAQREVKGRHTERKQRERHQNPRHGGGY